MNFYIWRLVTSSQWAVKRCVESSDIESLSSQTWLLFCHHHHHRSRRRRRSLFHLSHESWCCESSAVFTCTSREWRKLFSRHGKHFYYFYVYFGTERGRTRVVKCWENKAVSRFIVLRHVVGAQNRTQFSTMSGEVANASGNHENVK